MSVRKLSPDCARAVSSLAAGQSQHTALRVDSLRRQTGHALLHLQLLEASWPRFCAQQFPLPILGNSASDLPVAKCFPKLERVFAVSMRAFC
jgi:hypothetical protein